MKTATNKMETSSAYKVKEFNGGTLFAVISEYHIHSGYYKTRKGAEKMLIKVQTCAGEIKATL